LTLFPDSLSLFCRTLNNKSTVS